MTAETKGVDFEQEMRSAFQVFDVDGSGTISPEEIYKLMASLGENLSEEEIKSMVKEVDKNGDGSIDCMKAPLERFFESLQTCTITNEILFF